ncbi:uncharacterized protein G2W53_029025 [Senna tora]|uniref:Uncharacterized protein n=1 Tax=Senna tora TaxID=362788 RepID=A0A834T6F7_9FABA|nr:uncharacterized protein G2W53_029025 [Senna tora]
MAHFKLLLRCHLQVELWITVTRFLSGSDSRFREKEAYNKALEIESLSSIPFQFGEYHEGVLRNVLPMERPPLYDHNVTSYGRENTHGTLTAVIAPIDQIVTSYDGPLHYYLVRWKGFLELDHKGRVPPRRPYIIGIPRHFKECSLQLRGNDGKP